MSEIAAELTRYHELLDPLDKLSTSGPGELADEDRPGWEGALDALAAHTGDPLELEEAVAALARSLWVASAWAEPPARIADALMRRVPEWPEPYRQEGLQLADRFGRRALAIDQGCQLARIVLARVRLAAGDVTGADKAALLLPASEPATIALRSEIAAARGNYEKAIALRLQQIESAADEYSARHSRERLAALHRASGDTDLAIAVYRETLARFPDHGPSQMGLGEALLASGRWVDAYAALEGAVLLGHEPAQALLLTVTNELDRRSLERFRGLLRSGHDGDVVELCQPDSPSVAAVEA